MAQTGYTPILIYASGTPTNVPLAANLTSSASGAELALNYADGKLYFKNSSGVVTLLAGSGGGGPAAGSNTQVQFNNNGVFGASANMTFNGTRLTVADLADSGLTATRVVYSTTGGALTDSANLTFDGTNLTLGGGVANGVTYLNGSKVLTTGSALTFTGANLGVGIATAAQRVHIYESAAATGAFLQVQEVGGQNAYFGVNTSGGSIQVAGANPLQFAINGSEQMRLTSTGLGIGTSSPAARLQVTASSSSGTSGADGARFNAGGNVAINIGAESSSGYGWIQSANWGSGYIATAINPNGGNVGIGTSSPAARLSFGTSTGGATDFSSVIRIYDIGGSNGNNYGFGLESSTGRFSYTAGLGGFHAFYTANTERMRIDPSGNLGLGVTPSASISGRAFEIGLAGHGIMYRGGADIALTQNAYWTLGAWRYGATTGVPVSAYLQIDGQHRWLNAPSGTAGSGISFTQAMTLDASGNLGVGTTSPSNRLNVVSTSTDIVRFDSTSASNYGEILIRSNGGAGNNTRGRVVGGFDAGGSGFGGFLAFNTTTTQNIDTERARIDSSGNLLVGTTSAGNGSRIYIRGPGTTSATASFEAANSAGATRLYVQDDGTTRFFGSAGSETARITSAGDFLVGGTSVATTDVSSPQINLINAVTADSQWSGRIVSRNTGNDTAVFMGNYRTSSTNKVAAIAAHSAGLSSWTPLYVNTVDGTNANSGSVIMGGNLLVGTTDSGPTSGTGIKLRPGGGGANLPRVDIVTTGSTGATSSYSLYSTGAGAFRFYVQDSGQINATSTSIAAISDITLKENVRDLETGLSEVMALKPRRFDWKNGDGKDVAGFIAQELEEVLPDLVYDYQYTADETKKSIKMGDILPTLVKAIQEQQAIINQLKARLDAANL